MTDTGLPFSWQPCPPPEPGKYETIQILDKKTDREGCAVYTIRRMVQRWDGEKWAVVEPSGWRKIQ